MIFSIIKYILNIYLPNIHYIKYKVVKPINTYSYIFNIVKSHIIILSEIF